MLSSSSALLACVSERMKGTSRIAARITTAKTRKTPDHVMKRNRISAVGGPITCPADPAAVAIPSAIDRFSSEAARPTTASTTPKPVPAMPNPTSTDQTWCASGVVEKDDSTRPSA